MPDFLSNDAVFFLRHGKVIFGKWLGLPESEIARQTAHNFRTSHKPKLGQVVSKMGSRQLFACNYCQRSNFKTQSGLQLHLRFSRSCNEEARINLEALDETDPPTNQGLFGNVAEVAIENGSQNGSDSGGMVMQADDEYDYAMPQLLEVQDENDWGVGGDSEDEDLNNDDPARERLIEFRRYVREVRDDMHEFTNKEVASVELLSGLVKKHASLDTYDMVMKWHGRQTAHLRNLEQYDPREGPEGFISRQVLIKRLAHRYNVSPIMYQEMPVILPSSGTKVNIVHYDVRDQVVSLLTDPRLSDDDWLHFDDDPFAPPPKELTHIADLNTGRAYRDTYHKLITRPGKQILVPIVWYIDGITTGQFDKCQVESLQLSLGILTRQARDKSFAWRKAGYVPNHSKSSSRGKKILQETNHSCAHLMPVDANEGIVGAHEYVSEEDIEEEEYRDCKAQDWHRILGALLKSFRKLEKEGMVWDYKYKGKLYKDVELVFFTVFVKCDGAEADKLTGHYQSRFAKVQNICRYCTIPTALTDEVAMPKCAKVKTLTMMRKLNEREDLEGLKKISQQFMRNAWHDLQFGMHNDTGIHGACPMELLHQILLGIFKYIRTCFKDQIGKSSKKADEINALAQVLGRFFARQSDRDLPKTTFCRGIFEGKLMGKEMSGVLLLMAAILQTEHGQKILKTRRSRFGKQHMIDDWVLLVETLLQWEAYLKLDEMEVKHVRRLKTKHSFLMFLIKKIGNRTEGMGLKIMKFHGILHICDDIINNGVPNVVDTGANETHHKETKVAAQLTQKDITTFEKQTAQRCDEFFLLDLANAEIQGRRVCEYFCLDQVRGAVKDDVEDDDETVQAQTYGTQIEVYWDDDREESSWQMANSKTSGEWANDVVDYLYELQMMLDNLVNGQGSAKINIRTEHKRDGQIFRGHPNFKKRGQWNDWAVFDWGTNHGKLPAEIWCFVDFSELPDDFSMDFGDCKIQKGVFAVVESSYYDVKEDGSPNSTSEMFTPLIKEADFVVDGNIRQRKFYLADVEAIVSSVCVIPDVGCNKLRYFEVAARKTWPKLFVNWLMATHKMDAYEMADSESDEDSD